jgi:hypothetical protein
MAATSTTAGKSHLAAAGILMAAVALGALREFLFLNLNYQVDAVARNRPISYAHSMFQAWVHGWDLPALLRLKWALALLFAAAMAVACVLLARVLFGDHRFRRTIIMAYAIAGAVALLLHFLAAAHPAFGNIGVKLLHALQYPVVLFFVWAGAVLQRARR